MELTNEFRVSVPVEDAWAVLTDVERIAPCLPGAQLQEIEGDEYRGIVKVKVGPITAQYKGKATFQSRDDDAHVAVLKAEGRDTRGQGNASAIITATLTSEGGGTAVKVVTDLTITGKVAQFGRGVLVDVSGKLLTQFVECLENDLLSGKPSTSAAAAGSTNGAQAPPEPVVAAESTNGTSATPAASGAPASSRPPSGKPASPEGPPAQSEAESKVRKIEHQAAAPVDLLDAAGVPVAKRAIPVVAGVLVILWFLRRRRRKR
ncbi:MAG: SRPBCC domain-containing protein [Actinomycetota bacterium]|nr:SRPBCC domain-containing protein [Actinomycetota bacterium]